MKYQVGQRVVFIGPDFRSHPAVIASGLIVPVPRSIYTIRSGRILPAALEQLPNGCAIGYLLNEIVNRPALCLYCGEVMEIHVGENMLRPLLMRKNDGEAFIKALVDVRAKVDA